MPDGTTLAADRDRLQTIFENLFRNAVEHGSTGSQTESGDAVEHGSTGSQTESDDAVEHGGETVTVEVGVLEADGPVGFYVEDDGPGIPEANREDVFEKGYTTATGGTGFGLAIVESGASAHGWAVSVTDGDMGGARFEFRDVEGIRTGQIAESGDAAAAES